LDHPEDARMAFKENHPDLALDRLQELEKSARLLRGNRIPSGRADPMLTIIEQIVHDSVLPMV